MPQPMISVEHLSKAYRLGLKEEMPDTFVGAFTGWLKAPLRNWKRLKSLNTFDEPVAQAGTAVAEPGGSASNGVGEHVGTNGEPDDLLWALRDVSFEVNEGEVVGIIGRNGAGKSTLLKILSRITEPTHGRAVIRGRVSSLLEVGTGFHPELTGRENIYMNGTILGMRKKEIDKKFDEIVDFSGVEKFLDTPIKRYSSGMQVRLAFAVAAHLEPEILIIDEVLAVGDAEFQKKCLGKMQDVATQGRTVLFVSHNMPAVRNLCRRTITLSDGRRDFDGATEVAIDRYLSTGLSDGSFQNFRDPNLRRTGNGTIQFESAEVQTLDGQPCHFVPMGEGFRIRMEVLAHEPVSDVVTAIGIFDLSGTRVCGLNSSHTAHWTFSLDSGQKKIYVCDITNANLAEGQYRLNLILKTSLGNEVYDAVEGALTLGVEAADVFGTGHVPAGKNIIFLRPVWQEDVNQQESPASASQEFSIANSNHG